MDPRKLFVDEWLAGICAYCGDIPGTRDHIPSRVLLDEPFPINLAVVEACRECNESFSRDEEYVACLVECVISGTVNSEGLGREKIRRVLNGRPSLAAKLRDSRVEQAVNNPVWRADMARVRNVILKLARGHLAFELNVFHFEEPNVLKITPLVMMSREEFIAFESPSGRRMGLYPEIGSCAFISTLESPNVDWRGWHDVQSGRYRYRVEQSSEGDFARFVIGEYLACEVIWA